jgi:uncharacterized membrane protein YfcA
MTNESIFLLLIGFLVGTFGTLIGAGGGFIMVPVLLFMYPNLNPESITAISLTVVCFNALSGTIAYAYKKRIDYKSAIIFSLAASPGTILGVYAISFVPRKSFEFGFGLFMVLISIYLFFGAKKSIELTLKKSKHPVRILVDREGHEHQISYNSTVGIILSVVVGFLSSLSGIGGGIIHVPAMVKLLDFPVHIATATSHAILMVMAAIGVMEHYLRGNLNSSFHQIIFLVPSVMLGAQLGAHLSSKVRGTWIIKGLAIALASVGVRLLIF